MLTPKRAQTARFLQETVLRSIQTSDPFVQEAPEGSVFRNSFDWHSSVHAHWASLSIARLTGDLKSEQAILARLSDQALERERDYLAKNPTFELPYGRAWLAVLLDELARRPQARTSIFLALQNENLATLATHLEDSPFPESEKGLVATHGSWLFADWLLSLCNLPPEYRSRQQAWRERRITPEIRMLVSQKKHVDWDFLDLPTVLYLIEGKTEYPELASPSFPGMQHAHAHLPGSIAVRSWPYALEFARLQNPRAGAQFDRRLNELLIREEYWNGRFEWVSHWVPQFIWMGIWLEAGRP